MGLVWDLVAPLFLGPGARSAAVPAPALNVPGSPHTNEDIAGRPKDHVRGERGEAGEPLGAVSGQSLVVQTCPRSFFGLHYCNTVFQNLFVPFISFRFGLKTACLSA